MSTSPEDPRPEDTTTAQLAERQRALFHATAAGAERLAETAEQAAAVHETLRDTLPGAAEHAARDRRFAAAERAAAAALRQGELPPDWAREAIRDPSDTSD
jgi:hypothetical protein